MMTRTPESNWLGRTWRAVTEASAAAVAIHYAAPWKPAPRRAAPGRGACTA